MRSSTDWRPPAVVLARYARNRRLADACYLWAFAAITASPGARTFYDARGAAGDTYHRALRALDNRLVAILHVRAELPGRSTRATPLPLRRPMILGSWVLSPPAPPA